MTINYQTQRVTVPTVYVTKGRQRVKQYDNKVYLKNEDEFELELFNPTTEKVLAKISLNGKSLGSGIILRPGERVFLERYFDEARKFLFETYEVNGADPNVKEAIRHNGLVEVEFYQEYKPNAIVWNSGTWTYYPNQNYPNPTITVNAGYANQTLTSGNTAIYNTRGANVGSAKGTAQQNTEMQYSCFCNNIQMDSNIQMNVAPEKPMETGRVEKGSTSNQSFVYDDTTFNSYYTWKQVWNILPDSQRPVVKEDLGVFCTDCGAKRKKPSHRFCPNCGNRF